MEAPEDIYSPQRPPTLRDVAEAVGVSIATASAVLNSTKSGTRVSDATRKKLTAAALEMGYRPNELARALFRRRTRLIGFYAQFEHLSSANLFLSELIGGMQDATRTADCDLVLHTIPPNATPEEAFSGLGDRRVDGLVFFAPQQPTLLAALIQASLPVISVVDESDLVPSVVVDDFGGMRTIVQHLHDLGHRHVIFRDWHTNTASVANRRRGVIETATSLGMEISFGRVMDSTHEATLLASEQQALREGATAFICWEDSCAALTAYELERAEIAVPTQVAVTGFNGLRTVPPMRHDVTTIDAPWREVGRRAVDVLQSLVLGEPTTAKTVLPVQFHRGKTS